MTDKRQPGVIGSLPSTRPHRRSSKRAAPGSPADASTAPPAAPATELKPAAASAPNTAAKPAAASTPNTAAKPVRAKPAAARTHATDRSRARAAAGTPQPTPASAERERAARGPSPARDPAPPAPAPTSPGVFQTALEATAELTEIGLRAGARALRATLSRLPKP
jgi:hypothetical protein